MTPSPNCIKNKVGILIWFLQRLDLPAICCSFLCIYEHCSAGSLCVALVMGGRPFFVQLAYSTTMCLLDLILPVAWWLLCLKGLQCTLRGSDKQIEPASFLPLLFGYMQNNCSICVNCFFLLFLFPLEVTARIFASTKACVGAWRFEAGANVRFAPWCNNSGEKQCREECSELNLSRGSAAVASFGESPCDARAGMREGVCEGR